MGRLKPQPFREVKHRLEATGFVEASQKGSHVKFTRRLGETVDTVIVPKKREIPLWVHCAAFSTRRTLVPISGTSWADHLDP